MINRAKARQKKALIARVKRVGSASFSASLLVSAPALANGAAFNQVGVAPAGAFGGLQHHAVAMPNLTHAGQIHGGVAASLSQSHKNSANSGFLSAAHLHLANQLNNNAAVGWQQGGVSGAFAVPAAQKLSIGGGNLDLQSAATNIVLGARMFNGAASASIVMGGVSRTFQPGQKATAAEYVALTEVLSAGSQTLSLNSNGVAVGGDFSLNTAAMAKVASIVIPTNVVALDNLAASSTFSLRGDLLNYGSLISYSNSAAITSGTIYARDIVNESGGLISAQSQTSQGHVDLTLVATKNFSNAGTVVADGSLNLLSGNGNFANSGLVQSTGGNINFASNYSGVNSNDNSNTAINITSTGAGSFQAQAGDINIRNSAYNGGGNVSLSGGDYLSNNLNIYAGTGAITGNVGRVTGQLNSQAGMEHLVATTSNLVLGHNTVDGDPTFVNNGDITISGVNTFTEDVAIIANGNITTTNGAQIVDHGYNVTLLAGVNVETSAPSTSGVQSGANGISGTATIDFADAANKGGDINFSTGAASTPIDTSGFNTNGGNVTLAAFANGATGGNIRFDGASTINTSTSAQNSVGGLGGNVIVIAGGAGGATQTINLGSVITSGGGLAGSVNGGQGGSITLTTAQPAASTGTQLNFNSTGGIVGNNIVAGAPVSAANINVTGTLNTGYPSNSIDLGVSGGAVSVTAGGGINIGAIQTNGGNGNNLGGGPSPAGGNGGNAGAITLTANGGALTMAGDINGQGGAAGNATGTDVGGNGGAGANLEIRATGNLSLQNVNLNGGNGGNGGDVVIFTTSVAGGNGGNGGASGWFNVGADGVSVSIGGVSARGGDGGTGGTGGQGGFGNGNFAPGAGGSGGGGGAGGLISLGASNAAILTIGGNLDASGGAGGKGGQGGAGGQTGEASGNPGATGGAGGWGGSSGSIGLSCSGNLNVSSGLTFSANGGPGGDGGQGGNGSSAGYQPAFASGNGGDGGKGGFSNYISLSASNLVDTPLNVIGGAGGAGGIAGTIGTPLGVSGASGSSYINGDVTLVGSGTIVTPITATSISITSASNGNIIVDAPLTASVGLTLSTYVGGGSLTINAPIIASIFSLSTGSGDLNASLQFYNPAQPGAVSLYAPGGAINVSSASAINGSAIALGAVNLTAPTIVSSQIIGASVNLNAPAGSDLTVGFQVAVSEISASSGDVTINGSADHNVTIENAGVITALSGNIDITAVATSTSGTASSALLEVLGNGSMKVGVNGTITLTADAGTGTPSLARNSIYFSESNEAFTGNTVLNATGPSGSITLSGSNLTSTESLTLNTSSLILFPISSLKGSPLVINSGAAAGTIASVGDLDLSTLNNLTYEGAGLAIIASGSITDGGKPVAISTANPTGVGGNVTIIGGYTFTSSPGVGPVYPNPDTTDTFTLGSVSSGNTAISLGHTSIDTSGATNGGNVAIYGAGSVTVGAINTNGASSAGNVNIIGKGVDVTGVIDASASAGLAGKVSITGGAAAVDGPVYITNGFVYGSPFYSNATDNVLVHSISADGQIQGGQISLQTGGGTTFTIGSTAKTNVNGVAGTLSAAGPGGELDVTSLVKGITNATALNNFQIIQETTGGAGTIALGSSLSKNTGLQLVSIHVADGNLVNYSPFTVHNLLLEADNGGVGLSTRAFVVDAAVIDANSSGVLNVNDSNADAKIGAFDGGSLIKFVGAGNVEFLAGVGGTGTVTLQAGKNGSITLDADVFGKQTSIIANGTGAIIATANPTVTGASVKLTSKSGAIGSAQSPLQLNTPILTESTTGSTYLNDTSSAPITFNGSNTTGAFSLFAGAPVTIARSIAKAASIDIETNPLGYNGGIAIKGALGGAGTSSVVLVDGGLSGSQAGGITSTAVITTKSSGSISLTSGQGNIGTGTIGTKGALKVSTGNLSVAEATGEVNIINAAKYASNVIASSSGQDFNLKTAQSTTINAIAAGGNLNVVETAGTLSTASGSILTTAHGNALLEEVSTSGGIMLNSGTVISTHATLTTSGNVIVSIGAPPATVASGMTPANVTVNDVSGGSVFFGKGITANANGGLNVVNLAGSNVTFNTGKASATAIVLDGDVTITADPVVTPATATGVLNAAVTPAHEPLSVPVVAVVSDVTGGVTNAGTVERVALLPTAAADSSLSFSAIGQSNLAVRTVSVFNEPGWISQTELSSGEIPASISSDFDLGIKPIVSSLLEIEEVSEFEPGDRQIIGGKQLTPLVGGVTQIAGATKVMQLNRGAVVFAPTQNMIVRTPAGDVRMAAHVVVMVMAFDKGVAVYNLYDRHAGAVSVVVSGTEMKLTPGGMAVVAPASARSFAEVNPAQLIGYSNLSERVVGAGIYKIFGGQFSLAQAVGAVLPLRQLISAKNVEAKKLSAKILKTSAILQQLSGGTFEQVVRPVTTAWDI